MKHLKNTIALALLIVSSAVMAQQETALTLYMYNMNLINPAYVGLDNVTMLSANLRKQWSGVDQAPETQAISFGTPLGKNLGIGLSVIADKTFIERQNYVSVDFSYKIQLSERLDLYMGIKAGGSSFEVNTAGLETYNIISDPALASLSSFNPNFGVGGVLRAENWYASISVPRLLSNERARTELGYALVSSDKPHVYVSAGYDYKIDPTFTLKPSILMRYVNGSPVALDLNTMLGINELFEIGAMYRTTGAYAGMSTLRISKRLLFGYVYEMSTMSTLASVRNTNELLLQFRF